VTESGDISAEVEGEAAVCNTVATADAPTAEKPKRRGGRPKGSVNKTTRAAKEAIAEAEPERVLIRIMNGEKFMRAPEPGAKRKVACYPTLAETAKAADTLLRKICPDVKAVELGGIPDGEPVKVASEKVDDLELARHVAHMLGRADNAVSEEVKHRPIPDGFSARSKAETPAPVPGATNSTDAPVAAPQAADEAKTEPVPPKVGEAAIVGPYRIECREPQREGLPPGYAIR